MQSEIRMGFNAVSRNLSRRVAMVKQALYRAYDIPLNESNCWLIGARIAG